jgi:hypothetical protein
MSWWHIQDEHGYIDWGLTGGQTSLRYYVPGQDSTENHYIGSEVLELLDLCLELLLPAVKARHAHWIQDFFLQPKDLPHDDRLAAGEIITRTRHNIDVVYQRDWNRLPYPEELAGLFAFCSPNGIYAT